VKRINLSPRSEYMKRFLLHVLTWVVMSNVALAVSPGAAARIHRGVAVSPGALGSAGRRGGGAQAARLGREFKLKAGRSVTFDKGGLRLRFVSVASDSRCPVNVNCVWAGNAEVLIEVGVKGGRGKKTLRLNTNASPERPGEGKYGHYTVKLLGLSPQPREGRKISAGGYTATLLVNLVIVD
jgi:hypothetical protein